LHIYCNLKRAGRSNQTVDNQTVNQLLESDLVQKVLLGDRLAFGIIVKNTEKLVSMIVSKMITSPADRKDLVQDVYLKVFHNLAGFKQKSKLSTWIGQIAYNSCLHYLNKKQLVLTGELYGDESGTDATDGPEVSLSGKELSGILQLEIAKLSPVYRTLITMFHREELSYGEITHITGLPEGTVKNYLFRARKQLKQNILANYKLEEL
jgi:RNA polymerase sigma factor (sigma-70 family)